MVVDLSKLSATPSKIEDVVLYLQQAIPSLIAAIGEVDNTFSKTDVAPAKPREGMLRQADGTNWNPGSGAGIYRYTGGAWVLVMGSTGAGIYAPLASPIFTGDPKAPTPAAADNDTSLATTAFLQTELKAPTTIGSVTPNTGKFTTIDLTTAAPASPVASRLYKNAGRCVEIERQIANNSPTLDFVTGLDARFDLLAFECIDIVPGTDIQSFLLQVSEDGGATWKAGANDYAYSATQADEAGAVTGNGAANATAVSLAFSQRSSTPLVSSVLLFKPAGTAGVKRMLFHTAHLANVAQELSTNGKGRYKGTTNAINGVRFLYAAGNIASGKIICSGLLSA